MSTTATRFARALDLVEGCADLLAARPTGGDAPAWLEARGWLGYLEGLSDADLARAEEDVEGWCRAVPAVPPTLRALAEDVRAVVALPALAGARPSEYDLDWTGVRSRKRSQIDALVATLGGLAASCRRVVDVGAGAGHLARVASERWDRAALGVDRDARLLELAVRHAAGGRAVFRIVDVFAEALPLEADDLVLGLHACGEVTDVALAAAAASRATVAVVSCCLQKLRGARRFALSARGRSRGFVSTREVLGLSNVMPRSQGVEVPQERSLLAREARHVLRVLLAGRGIATEVGEEMRGLNRRRARHGVEALARESFARRGLAAPTATELERAARVGRLEFGRLRRWSLPRTLLARAVECAVALDRATFLEESGYEPSLHEAFPSSVSPRNVLLVASPSGPSLGLAALASPRG